MAMRAEAERVEEQKIKIIEEEQKLKELTEAQNKKVSKPKITVEEMKMEEELKEQDSSSILIGAKMKISNGNLKYQGKPNNASIGTSSAIRGFKFNRAQTKQLGEIFDRELDLPNDRDLSSRNLLDHRDDRLLSVSGLNVLNKK